MKNDKRNRARQELDKLKHGLIDMGKVDPALPAIFDKHGSYSGVMSYFGGREFLPSSVMSSGSVKLDADTDAAAKERSGVNIHKKLRAGEKSSVMSSLLRPSGTGSQCGALSTFPQKIGRTMTLLYTKPGDIVFDPFAGHNSRMELVVKTGRHYYGHDLNHDFMVSNNKRAAYLRSVFPKTKIWLAEADSRDVDLPSDFADFTITSPPYFDLEDYGDDPAQLQNDPHGYEGFMLGIRQVLGENFRILKPGAFCVWYVGDFRKKGKLVPFHIDVADAAETEGFTFHDIAITEYPRGLRDIYVSQTLTSKVLPKRHEYGLVFQKP